MNLFQEPFDLDSVERLLGDEWEHFGALANMCCGRRKVWEAAVDQLGRLFWEFEGTDRDEGLLYRLFDMLAARAHTFDDTAAAQEWMLNKLTPDPAIRLSFEHRLFHIHKTDRKWHERDHVKLWLREHQARLDAMGQRDPDAPLVISASLKAALDNPMHGGRP